MERIELDSKTLAWVGYSPEWKMLELGFRTGRIYEYYDVPRNVFQELLTSESKGAFFNLQIRNRFRYRRVKPL
jgi:hypothetical protein